MNARSKHFYGGVLFTRIAPKNSEQLRRGEECSGDRIVRPTAHAAKFLSLVQVVLALPQLLFGLLTLDNLEFQVLIGTSERRRPLRYSHFEIVSSSRNLGHQ